MKKAIGQACGKMILSGEYAVVFGHPGIAVPASFMVTVRWEPCHTEPVEVRHGDTGVMVRRAHHDTLTITYSGIEKEEYLHRILDEITTINGPLHGHLTIENTIPIGRGMGSSTALVIAIYRCLLEDQSKSPLPWGEGQGEGHIKKIALSIENTVNPGHSGLDFAVIWEGKPVKFTKKSGAEPIDLDLSFLENAVLIDTGKPNETTPELVAWVKKNSLSPRERARVRGALHTIARCTERLTQGESPLTVFPDHHRAQVAIGVVPEPVQALITEIEKARGAAKVVGAGGRTGGGGMVLALLQQPQKLLTIAKQHNMPIIAWE